MPVRFLLPQPAYRTLTAGQRRQFTKYSLPELNGYMPGTCSPKLFSRQPLIAVAGPSPVTVITLT